MPDLLLVFRDGRANSNSRADTERSAERAERRGDAAGNGAIPVCVFGQGLNQLLLFFHTECNNVFINVIMAL